MRRTTFAGLDRLEAGDPTTIDGGAALGRDKDTTDHYFSQIPGHHHNGAGPLANPLTPPAVTSAGATGHLPLDTTLYATYTLLDGFGGETMAAPFVSFSTGGGIGSPPPLASGVLNFASGSLPVNVFSYVFTVKDAAGGETLQSLPIRVERDPGPASACVVFTGLHAMLAATPGGVTWALYKGVGGAPYAFLAAGSTDTFTDTGLISLTFGVQPPGVDTTNQTGSFNLDVPYSSAAVGGFKVYLSTTSNFVDPCLYGQYPQASGTMAINISSVSVRTGSPPPVSTAFGSPSKINPQTDVEWSQGVPILISDQVPNHVAIGKGISFAATGAASVAVSNSGGSALVTIGATGGGGGGAKDTGRAEWGFSLGIENMVLFPDAPPTIGGEFSSIGADGSPNVLAIAGAITIPPSPSGSINYNSSALIIDTTAGQGPFVRNFSSGAASGLSLYCTLAASDVTWANQIAVFASAVVHPSDALGTTKTLDSFSPFDWTSVVIVNKFGPDLDWDPASQQIVSRNPAGIYQVAAQVTATSP